MSDALLQWTDQDVLENAGDGVVLVDFWAPWCGPCQQQAPILEQVAQEIGNTARIAKINVDEHTAAAGKYGVQGIPTLLLLKKGQEVNRFVGLQTAQVLSAAIKKALAE